MAKIQPRSFKGTRDFTPREMIPREALIDSIKSVFRLYGFSPLETPALEMLEVLSGKYGDEGEKLLYKLDYKNDKPRDRVALRYDLTVPLARVVASNPDWPMPFKRYQVQPVWRADKPQPHQGRFREFYQCDVDTIGAPEGIADAEIIALTVQMIRGLGFDEGDRTAVVQLNHRKLLEGLCTFAGLKKEQLSGFTRILDKLDKIGRDAVFKELGDLGVTDNHLEALGEVLAIDNTNVETLQALRERLAGIETAQEGIDSLFAILDYLSHLDVPVEAVNINPNLARGLDYYTGAVFETTLPRQPHIGSLTGGGRYDELIALYSGRDLPAVGTTIGLDRIFAAMEQLGMVDTGVGSVTRALIAAYSKEEIPAALNVLKAFRAAGLPSELFPTAGKLKKPFSYADKQGIPFVAVIGPDEAADPQNLKVSLKQLAKSEQAVVTVAEAIATMLDE
ncbi:histidine--tRNA ligase [bacterium]|nr:histidine--tRNA ligase [bacterium]